MTIGKIKTVMDSAEWDSLVRRTYGKPYSFQQQEGCKPRGMEKFQAPFDEEWCFPADDEIPEKVNGEVMGVSLRSWLARDPEQPLANQKYGWQLSLFWERNFYPPLWEVVNDLYERGILPAGEYIIEIDW